MAKLEKIDYDALYPYKISDSWGGSVNLTPDDLQELWEDLKELKRIHEI